MSNEKSLNEQLAELCGMELRPVAGQMTVSGVAPCWRFPKGGYITQKEWNPTQDLNQLKMCYEAAEKDWDSHDEGSFQAEFEDRLRLLLECRFVREEESEYQRMVATAWVKHPELVAKAILEAKEVS